MRNVSVNLQSSTYRPTLERVHIFQITEMAFRCLILCAAVACASAGDILAPAFSTYAAPALAYGAPAITYAQPLTYSAPAITSQSSNIYRTAGNLGQISTYSKSIDTPFSSVRKADVRISNPGLRITAAAPALAYSAAPVAHAPLLGVAYSAAPAVSHITYDSGYAHYAI
ncbi:cuticle protein 67-like [Cylas formicarius]|uniref:cuticle protein 67-like n=1 Tax=Cylas formicarius TaxID=197179 RepID=UPI0029583A35|nr:cuticle protein 67-like [Cylas formicarius]